MVSTAHKHRKWNHNNPVVSTILISVHFASCYTHTLSKWLMYNIQTKTHVTYPTNCNTQNTIFVSNLQSVWSKPIPSSLQWYLPGRTRRTTQKPPASSPKRKRRRSSEGGGIDSQVVVVSVQRNACCFDVCIPKLWIQSICQCGDLPERKYVAYVEFDEPRLNRVVLTSHYLSSLTQHLLILCEKLCNNQQYFCMWVLFGL